MKNSKGNNIHFMGIGGSGLSAVALISKKSGYNVSGCNIDDETPYLEKLRKEKIQYEIGHSEKHIENCDILVATPAIHYQNKDHPEYVNAVRSNKFMEWSKFVGEYLLKDKNVIAVSGTHGKGTTCALLSLIFEEAGLDPSVLIGATVKQWNTNYRYGKSKIFLIEADEFYDKFLDYDPSTILINNIEFDHPDYFKNEKELAASFWKFVKKLKKGSNLVINIDSEGVIKLLNKINSKIIKQINVYGYSLKTTTSLKVKNFISASISSMDNKGTSFYVDSSELGIDDNFRINIPGEYNVSNFLGVLIISRLFNIETDIIKNTAANFLGTSRRLDKVFENKKYILFDDYAHHPTAIKKTLEGLRQLYPTKRIWIIDEPHSFSRTKALLSSYKGSFDAADRVIIGPIFKARDTKTFGVDGNSIIKVSAHKDIIYLPKFAQILAVLKKELMQDDVIIVMGAGESYKWTKDIQKMISKL